MAAFGAHPPDGILAVGDRPVDPRRATERRVRPSWQSRCPRRWRAATSSRAAWRSRPPDLPAPWFHPLSLDADPLRAVARGRLSGGRQAARAVGQPRRDPRQHDGRVRLSVRAAARAAGAARRARRARRRARHAARRVVHSRDASSRSKGVLTAGALRVFAIFDKPDPLDGPFFEETIYVTPSREHRGRPAADRRGGGAAASRARPAPRTRARRVSRQRSRGLRARGRGAANWRALLDGARFRVCGRRPRVARGGAAASRDRRGRRPLFARERRGVGRDDDSRFRIAAIYKGVDGEDAARARRTTSTDVRITAKPDTMLVPLPEGRSYLGFIFARAADAARGGTGAARTRTRSCGS